MKLSSSLILTWSRRTHSSALAEEVSLSWHMAEYQHGQPRALAPRRLEQQESLSSLNQWTATFRNYYRRCQIYGYFLTPGLTWTPDGTRGFLANEATDLKRTPDVLASDLDSLLQCIA